MAPPRLVRVRTRLSRRRRRGSCARTSCAEHERRHDHGGGSFDNLGLFALLPCLAEGFSGPAAGYSGLRNPSCPGFVICSVKPMTHVYRQSLGRELDRAAAVGAKYERIVSIGFSSWPLAITAARVPQLTANFKRKVVMSTVSRKIVISFCCAIQICSVRFATLTGVKVCMEYPKGRCLFNVIRSRCSVAAKRSPQH
jgi:hypothetical protein